MNSESVQVSERRRQVLRIVVEEYVRTAQPVGSHARALAAGVDVSPATLRNDLAALEEKGLLTHPHTSAGRIPTDAGYRYFVHELMAESELTADERSRIRMEFSHARQEMDQWLRTQAVPEQPLP